MILSSTNCLLNVIFDNEKSVEILAKAGFDAVDVSLNSVKPNDNFYHWHDYIDRAKKMLEIAKGYGIFFNQAHAVYPTSYVEEEKTKIAYDKILKDFEIANVLGVKTMVVHPNQHLCYVDGNNAELLKEMNFSFYKSLIPYCEQYGVKVAVENMWQKNRVNNVIIDSTCSRAPEFCEYIDMLDSPWITACLDLGHCGLVGQLPQNMIRALGHDRLGALHVHDNNGREDNHVEPMAPFVSSVDWEEVCKALAEIHYQGDFTFEAENIFKNANEHTVDAIAKKLHDIGRYLIGRIEYYKNVK